MFKIRSPMRPEESFVPFKKKKNFEIEPLNEASELFL